MRLLRVVSPKKPFAPDLPSAGERLKRGRSGDTQASTFGPPLPIVRPG